jgi:phage shock protein PspC (stress-responsive transcriptional regulator)
MTMRKVTTINLNNNAYQIDEDGFEALRLYLDNAARALTDNPDRAEILADLEQAIADKCRALLGPHKTVITSDEVRRILADMGPVEGSAAAGASTDSKPANEGAAAGTGSAPPGPGVHTPGHARRMYRISEGAMWGGVCNGLSAYFGVDVVWVRLVFVLATLATGFGLLVYIAMIFIVPRAETSEEQAAAHGHPFNAQELVDRIKKKHESFRRDRRYQRYHRRMSRHAEWWNPPASQGTEPAPGYAARVTGGLLLPVVTLLSAIWFAAMLLCLFVILGIPHGSGWTISPWPWPWQIPHWMVLVGIIAIYGLIAIPLGAGRRAARYYANGGRLHGWADAWSGLLWIALVVAMIAVAWYNTPYLQDLLRQAIDNSHSVSV